MSGFSHGSIEVDASRYPVILKVVQIHALFAGDRLDQVARFVCERHERPPFLESGGSIVPLEHLAIELQVFAQSSYCCASSGRLEVSRKPHSTTQILASSFVGVFQSEPVGFDPVNLKVAARGFWVRPAGERDLQS